MQCLHRIRKLATNYIFVDANFWIKTNYMNVQTQTKNSSSAIYSNCYKIKRTLMSNDITSKMVK